MDSSRDEVRLALRGRLPYKDAVVAKFALAYKEFELWLENESGDTLRSACLSIADAFLTLSEDRVLQIAEKRAAIAAGDAFAQLRVPGRLRQRLNRYKEQVKDATPAAWETVIGTTETEVRQACSYVRRELDPPPLKKLARLNAPSDLPDESTAALLLRGAEQGASARELPGPELAASANDMSQSKVKLTAVKLSNFRGIGSTIEVDLSRNGRPASVLIYGDNGVGKSSVVDGIEFALQGRVGRTQDFSSSFAPLLTNLSSGGSVSAEVVLSDGSGVARTLNRTESGRLVPDGDPPTPGFRWAPLTLKRSDILRFLDADPLSRGTVFFDYFPGDAEAMGTRPEERIVLLEEGLFALRVRRRTLARDLATRLGVTEEEVSSPDNLEKTLRESVLGGLTIRQATDDGVWDGLDLELKSVVVELRRTLARYRSTKNQIDRGVQVLNPKAYEVQAAQVARVMEDVGAELTTSFLKVARADYIQRINVLAAETGPVSLDIVVELNNGEKAFPHQVFSEGYRDLLALLFFLAVARASTRRGQAKVLVLDDVFQSVDSGIRLGVMSHVLENFSDWQLIVTLHDRLWYEQLRSLMRRRGFLLIEHRLIDWKFREGPRLSDSAPRLSTGLDAALASGDASLACAAAGRLLEAIASEASWRFRISVQRTKDDKYTLNDLWPGLVKYLRKSSLQTVVADIDSSSELRNLVGAHYNVYSEALSWEEARVFAENVGALFSVLYCSECADWLYAYTRTEVRCPCGRSSVPLTSPQ